MDAGDFQHSASQARAKGRVCGMWKEWTLPALLSSACCSHGLLSAVPDDHEVARVSAWLGHALDGSGDTDQLGSALGGGSWQSWAGFQSSWLPAPALSSRAHCCSAELAADAGTAAALLLIPVGMISPNEDPWEISTEYKNLAAKQRLRL